MSRTVVWFSCGAASAAAAKLVALTPRTHPDPVVVYCDLMADEHPDNRRFFDDVQEWIGLPITTISSDKYQSVDDVFAKRRYMSGMRGAPCTIEMKKHPRFQFERADDVHVFGFTSDEQSRIDLFKEANPELSTEWILADNSLTKDDCLLMLDHAGIRRPEMYELGYRNNNCLGCVKATSATYWNMIRRDFPDVFEKRARQSREVGARLTRVRNVRVFLDELPEDYLPAEPLEDISCGPDCATQLSWLAEGEVQ